MGIKQSKIEGCYLPDTPKLRRIVTAPQEFLNLTPINKASSASNDALALIDPRSPHICRTPLNLNGQPSAELAQQETTTASTNENNGLGMLRKRILKSLAFNLNDPRSPTVEFNRTPLVFDDSKAFDLNDTFADLFVETRTEPVLTAEAMLVESMQEQAAETIDTEDALSFKSLEVPCFLHNEETMACTMLLPQTPLQLQQEIDPRSPTIGMERTTLVFEDELNEANESAMLENVLAAMSLDNSSASSFISNGSMQAQVGEMQANKLAMSAGGNKPKNKHLERVRGSGSAGGRMRKRASRIRHEIYVDEEENFEPALEEQLNDTAVIAISTPKKRKCETTVRTPLSQLKNRQPRSRSVETKDKSLKKHLALTSYDDSLNPLQNASLASLRNTYDLDFY